MEFTNTLHGIAAPVRKTCAILTIHSSSCYIRKAGYAFDMKDFADGIFHVFGCLLISGSVTSHIIKRYCV